ncbi:MAG: class I SAM-dependent methyltransferase [Polyangiaceae bacterium]|nr:class I SAM-dependent methyltransferase [Polyangiaceae bacterium]
MTDIVLPGLDAYVEAHTQPRPEIFDELRTVTYGSMKSPHMQVGRVEGTFLEMLCALMGARRVLEIGTFTGYSALCMARALPDDGELVTLDIDPEATRIAQSFFDRVSYGKKIRIVLGDALTSLRALPTTEPFDLVFLDADKERYVDYYELVLPMLRKGGLLVADNTLWSGRVLAPVAPSDIAITRFNDAVTADARVQNVLLSVRDGMMLARKL